MNRFQKKILTIAAGLANIGLALSAAAVATYAWYSTNSAIIQNINDTISIATSIPESQLTWEILTYDDDEKSGISSNDNRDFFLQPYDQYLPQKNVYTNAILRATLNVSGS